VASLVGAVVVAGIAALASYAHMRGLALRYGQPVLIADLLPVSVDGMMVVATVALGDGRDRRGSAWVAFWTGVVASVTANVVAAESSVIARCVSAWPAVAFVLVVEVLTRGGADRAGVPGRSGCTPVGGGAGSGASSGTARGARARADAGGSGGGEVMRRMASGRSPAGPGASRTGAGKFVRRPVERTRELAANLRVEFPGITQVELAQRLGISATRLRQIDRGEPSVDRARAAESSDLIGR
jgi:hypothetical protein